MGYSHYWYQKTNKPFTTNEWNKIKEGVRITFAKAKKGLYAGKETANSVKKTVLEPSNTLAPLGINLTFRTGFAEKGAWRTFPNPDSPTPEHGKPIKLAGWDGDGTPEITDEYISFNGAEPDDYETFRLERVPKPLTHHPQEEEIDTFCKTEYRPYDAVVVSILALAKAVAPDKIRVESDGGDKAIRYLF